MDWKEFMRGLFGYSTPPPPQPPQQHRNPNQWPPPPPIPEFSRAQEEEFTPPRMPDLNQPLFPRMGFFWGQRPPGEEVPQSNDQDNGDLDGHGHFVFNDLFAMVGGMFQEMERSMRDAERFFGDTGIEDNSGRMFQHLFPSMDGAASIFMNPRTNRSETSQSGNSLEDPKSENLRDIVLKENDPSLKENSRNQRHYLAEPENPSDKVDRDLDVLYKKSMLDLSELPLPSGEGSHQSSHRNLTTPSPHGIEVESPPQIRSYCHRTYQTFLFKNGRMEGETVKENQNGRYVTKYHVDENGTRHETTEFYPKEGSSSSGGNANDTLGTSSTIIPASDSTSFHRFLDKIFRPRM